MLLDGAADTWRSSWRSLTFTRLGLASGHHVRYASGSPGGKPRWVRWTGVPTHDDIPRIALCDLCSDAVVLLGRC